MGSYSKEGLSVVARLGPTKMGYRGYVASGGLDLKRAWPDFEKGGPILILGRSWLWDG